MSAELRPELREKIAAFNARARQAQRDGYRIYMGEVIDVSGRVAVPICKVEDYEGKEGTMEETGNGGKYREAIRFAAETHIEFYKAHDSLNAAMEAGRSRDYCDMLMRHEEKLAAATCAQQELIAAVFGVSEEQVHRDLEAHR